MVLIILLHIAVKTTTNCCNDVTDTGSCWLLHAASLWIYKKLLTILPFDIFILEAL